MKTSQVIQTLALMHPDTVFLVRDGSGILCHVARFEDERGAVCVVIGKSVDPEARYLKWLSTIKDGPRQNKFEPLLKWRSKDWPQQDSLKADDLVDSLSCEGVSYNAVPTDLLKALTAFRHCNQKRRLALCERFLSERKRERQRDRILNER